MVGRGSGPVYQVVTPIQQGSERVVNMMREERAQLNQARDAKKDDMRLYIARMKKERDTMEAERNTWSDMFNRSIKTMKALEDELELEKRKKDNELSKSQVRAAQLEADVTQQKEKLLLDQDELQELRAKLYEIEKDKVHEQQLKATLASTSKGLKTARAGLSALENENDRLQEELRIVRETLGETVEQLRSQSAEYCKLKLDYVREEQQHIQLAASRKEEMENITRDSASQAVIIGSVQVLAAEVQAFWRALCQSEVFFKEANFDEGGKVQLSVGGSAIDVCLSALEVDDLISTADTRDRGLPSKETLESEIASARSVVKRAATRWKQNLKRLKALSSKKVETAKREAQNAVQKTASLEDDLARLTEVGSRERAELESEAKSLKERLRGLATGVKLKLEVVEVELQKEKQNSTNLGNVLKKIKADLARVLEVGNKERGDFQAEIAALKLALEVIKPRFAKELEDADVELQEAKLKASKWKDSLNNCKIDLARANKAADKVGPEVETLKRNLERLKGESSMKLKRLEGELQKAHKEATKLAEIVKEREAEASRVTEVEKKQRAELNSQLGSMKETLTNLEELVKEKEAEVSRVTEVEKKQRVELDSQLVSLKERLKQSEQEAWKLETAQIDLQKEREKVKSLEVGHKLREQLNSKILLLKEELELREVESLRKMESMEVEFQKENVKTTKLEGLLKKREADLDTVKKRCNVLQKEVVSRGLEPSTEVRNGRKRKADSELTITQKLTECAEKLKALVIKLNTESKLKDALKQEKEALIKEREDLRATITVLEGNKALWSKRSEEDLEERRGLLATVSTLEEDKATLKKQLEFDLTERRNLLTRLSSLEAEMAAWQKETKEDHNWRSLDSEGKKSTLKLVLRPKLEEIMSVLAAMRKQPSTICKEKIDEIWRAVLSFRREMFSYINNSEQLTSKSKNLEGKVEKLEHDLQDAVAKLGVSEARVRECNSEVQPHERGRCTTSSSRGTSDAKRRRADTSDKYIMSEDYMAAHARGRQFTDIQRYGRGGPFRGDHHPPVWHLDPSGPWVHPNLLGRPDFGPPRFHF